MPPKTSSGSTGSTASPAKSSSSAKCWCVGGDTPQLGTPTVAGATVAGEVLQHTRGDKVIAFKKRRRKNSRRKRGYRHEFSVIRITEILTGGAKPSKDGQAAAQARAQAEGGSRSCAGGRGQAGRAKAKKPAKKPAAAKKPGQGATKRKKK